MYLSDTYNLKVFGQCVCECHNIYTHIWTNKGQQRSHTGLKLFRRPQSCIHLNINSKIYIDNDINCKSSSNKK